jgi:hypothetical protein
MKRAPTCKRPRSDQAGAIAMIFRPGWIYTTSKKAERQGKANARETEPALRASHRRPVCALPRKISESRVIRVQRNEAATEGAADTNATTLKRNAGCRLWAAIRHLVDVQQRLNCALRRHLFELRFPFGIRSLHGIPATSNAAIVSEIYALAFPKTIQHLK